jgi:putative membrane protein insertion efficiency factor
VTIGAKHMASLMRASRYLQLGAVGTVGIRRGCGRYGHVMVFIGGWRSRRGRGFGQRGGNAYGPYAGPGYGPPPGYGRPYRRNSSCGRDLCLLEGGCCAAEMLGCGPQATLLAPTLLRRAAHAAVTPATKPVADLTGPSRAVRFLDAAIRIYQTEISPKRPATCRYDPSCSEYARQSLHRHGLLRGATLTIRRLARCRPGAPGGRDLVPPQRGWSGHRHRLPTVGDSDG